MTHLPGFLFGTVVAGVERVVGQGAAAGAVDPHPAIVATDLLQADIESTGTIPRRKQRRNRAVVQVAGFGAAVFAAAEITQIGAQRPVAQRLAVGHLQVLLLVDVLQLGIPQPDQRALLIEGVFTPDKVEAIGRDRGVALHEHVLHARIVTRAVFAELAAIEAQAVDVLRRDLSAFKGLRQ